MEKIVDEILIPMYDTFLNKDMNYDYFKESSKDTKGELAEKEDQQELFSKTTWNQEEYFFYDMESAKKHDNRDELSKDENNNRADMMAIRFNEEGTPVKLVFVEMKTKKGAYLGDSGLDEHIKKMIAVEGKEFDSKKIEAYKIINQYWGLGIKNNNNIEKCTYDFMMKLEKEILIVLTREAKNYWSTYEKNSLFRFEKCLETDEKFLMYRVI